MRIGIVVDAACDLPAEFLEQQRITVLPFTLRLDEEVLVDDRNADTTRRYLAENLGARGHSAETEPYSVEQIRDLFLGRLVLDYDCVFCLTITSTRSPTHARASQASFSILKDYRPIRRDANVPGPFLMRVIDTENLFAAEGVATSGRADAAGEKPRARSTIYRGRARASSRIRQRYSPSTPIIRSCTPPSTRTASITELHPSTRVPKNSLLITT